MATLKFIIRSDKINNRGQAPVYLRIYHAGKKRQKKLDIYIAPDHWNKDKQQVRKSHPKSTRINLDLMKWRSRAQEAVRKAEPLTAQSIKNRLEGVNPLSYFNYVDSIIDSYDFDYHNYIQSGTNKLKKFRSELKINEITPSFIKKFERYLLRSVCQNTASQYISIIRTVLYRAIDDDLIKPGDSPFSKKSVRLKWEDTDPTPLTWDQFKKLRDVQAPQLQLYKDMFLFSVYMDGMRLTDVLKFQTKWIKGGRAKYRMSKTGKQKEIKIVPAAEDIIKRYGKGRYIFPLLNPNLSGQHKKEEIKRLRTEIWKKVKVLGKCANLGVHLHFHMARNTSGFIAYKNGWTLPEIQELYRHSTIQQTRNYLGKMAPEVLDEKRDSLWKK